MQLNNKQQEAVLHTDGPLLILAGAGSGKTRVITNRIARLVRECGVDPHSILAITFTNKAAGEMRSRIENDTGIDAAGAWICTFHSACVRILRLYIHLLGYENNFTIYDRDDQITVVKNICKKLDIDTKRFKERGFLNVISSAKDELISPSKFEMDNSKDFYGEKAAKVYKDYQQELKKNNALDFDDLIYMTVELFRKEPEILERFQDRFRYISVDEYQDTNTAQFVFVSLLAKKYKNICVVGDDDQSIYKFRGANIENILNFEKAFPGAKVIRLEQNYRSTSNILDAANAVISNNTQRKVKTLWTEKESGSKIKLFYTDNPYVEADRIIQEIRTLQDKGYSLSSCACLYRTNSQSRALEEAFLRANIPYKIVGGVNFYQRKEIKDILAYLKTIDNGRDDVAVRRIINVPKRGIGAAAVNSIQAFADMRGINFYSALDTGVEEGAFGRSDDKLRKFRDLMDIFRTEAHEMSLTELLDDVLSRTGYLKELQEEKTVEAETRIENIDELINKLKQYENENEAPTLNGFLEEVALIADIDSWDGEENYVSLITIHSAKGLEFDNVFICGLEDGLFPMNASIVSTDPTELEEERRLAYVAITRARDNLFLTAAKSRMVRGETTYSVLSRFVKEIPPLLLEPDRNNVYVPRRQEMGSPASNSGRDVFKAKPYGGTDVFGTGSSLGDSACSKSILAAKPYAAAQKKQFEVKSSAGLSYQVGDSVSHIKFGEGVVLAIDEGGRDYEVTVEFEEFGVKKMFAAFAKLKKI